MHRTDVRRALSVNFGSMLILLISNICFNMAAKRSGEGDISDINGDKKKKQVRVWVDGW